MVEFVSLYCGELGPKFVKDEFIGFGPISVAKDQRVAEVEGIGSEVLDRKNVSDELLGGWVNIFAEENGRLAEVGCLTRDGAKLMESVADVVCLLLSCLSTNKQVICKKERVNFGAVRPKHDPLYAVILHVSLES